MMQVLCYFHNCNNRHNSAFGSPQVFAGKAGGELRKALRYSAEENKEGFTCV